MHERDEDYQEYEEHEHARRLLAPLAAEPTRPSTVDIRRAIAVARRRLRIRRIAGVGAVAAVTGLAVAAVPVVLEATSGADQAPPPAAASGSPTPEPSPTAGPEPLPPPPAEPQPPTRCQLELLPEPDGAYQSLVTAADPTGRFIAGRTYTSGTELAAPLRIWDDGEPFEVDIPGFDAAFEDLNSRGAAVAFGSAPDEEDGWASWYYQDGQVTELGADVRAAAINEHGTIVGTRDPYGRGAPVVWRSPTAPPEELSVPGPTWSVSAQDVDADGTVVGGGHDQAGDPYGDGAPTHLFVWRPDGTRQEFPVPAVDEFGYFAASIDHWIVTALVTEPVAGGDTIFHRVRYDLRTGEPIDPPPDVPVEPQAWNAHGWMAGAGPDGLALWTPSGGLVPLPLLDLGNGSGDEEIFNFVTTVSDDGRVLAGQVDDGEQYAHAAAWRCE